MKKHSAQRLYTIVSIVMTLLFMILWWGFTQWYVLIVYLCAINMTTLLLYAWDKVIAGGSITRVPEMVFHSLSLLGGSPMAMVGQKAFRHKTLKHSFKTWFWISSCLHAVLAILLFWWL